MHPGSGQVEGSSWEGQTFLNNEFVVPEEEEEEEEEEE